MTQLILASLVMVQAMFVAQFLYDLMFERDNPQR
ncbi:hypothetical protein J2X11_000619 [Aeromicrobium panaciterrae]|uniref:Uncharacterized protein n=1 Tax=Aeromicrobium panaciterrae TaxID=363861 RepID=A0ABU1UKS6_9ACTN|nr:hypothetical protein [Aeromicrobium panaciterrae]